MTTTESDGPHSTVATSDILRRVMAQREHRYTDAGPDLGATGVARFRHEGSRLFVAYGRPAPSGANAMVSRVITYARRTSSRVIWNVSETGDGAYELTSALLAYQFTLDERLTLLARLGPLQARTNPMVTVETITSWAEMWAYERGSRGAFYNDPTPDMSVVTARASERWRQQEMGWYRYYHAKFSGSFVGGAYVSLWEDVPTLMGVYTIEAARNQGVATATLAHMVASVLRNGKTGYCLFVKEGNPARRLYESLGFVAMSDEATYFLDV